MLTTEHLRDVDAVFTVGTHTVVAVGDNGTIIRSADDGETWSLQTMMPATTRHLYGVFLFLILMPVISLEKLELKLQQLSL